MHRTRSNDFDNILRLEINREKGSHLTILFWLEVIQFNVMYISKGPVTHTVTHVQRTKNEEFWSVRCESLGVRQNSLMIWRERLMSVIYFLCASTSAHIFCMLKNVSVFRRVNVDARRTSDQRQSNVRHK